MKTWLRIVVCCCVLLCSGAASHAQKPELVVQLGHSWIVSSVVFSPDGKTLASGSGDHTIKLWDAASGQLLRTFTGHSAGVTSVAFSRDGKTLASGSGDATIKLWDVASGQVLRTFTGHSERPLGAIIGGVFIRPLSKLKQTSGVESVAFSADGKTLASGSEDKTIKLWDVASGQLLRTLKGHSLGVESVAFSADGKTLASGSLDKTIRLWDAASGQLLHSLTGHSNWVHSVAFSADGKMLASGSQDGTIKLWDVALGQPLRTLIGHSSDVESVAFSADGKMLASGSQDKTIKLWDVASGQSLRTLIGHFDHVLNTAFSADGKMLASGSQDGTIKLWDVASGQVLNTLQGHSITSVAFSADRKTLALGSEDRSIKLWDVASGQPVRTLIGHSGGVESVAFNADGKMLASGSQDKTIKLWDVASGQVLRTLEDHSWPVNSVAFSADGKTLASGSLDATTKLWDVTSGKLLRTLAGHSDMVFSVAFSLDGKTLASGSFDKTIKLWDVISGKLLRTLAGHSDMVFSVAFGADGKTLASGSFDKTIKLWDAASGQVLRTLTGHLAPVFNIAFSIDGRMLASGSLDGTTKLWNVASGDLLHSLQVQSGGINSVSFSPDDKTLASGSRDTSFRLWNLSSNNSGLAVYPFDNGDYVVLDAQDRFDGTPGGLKQLHYVVGLEPIALDQLKERYYQPGLWGKVMGSDPEPLRPAPTFDEVKLFPAVQFTPPAAGQTQLSLKLTNRGGGIGRVQVLVNDKEVIADARPAGFDPQAAQATLTVDLKDAPLVPGKPNQIEVIARNAEDYLASPRGVGLAWVPPLAAAAEPPELYAIVGGISAYSAPQLGLRYAAKDAADFATALRVGAGKLFGVRQVHLALLTSAAGAAPTFTDFTPADGKPTPVAPTKANFRQAFAAARRAKSTDILVVYLAGHGLALARGSDLYCYLTQEARSNDVAALNDPGVLGQTAVTSEELTEWIKAIPALKQVMVLDTCAAGAAAARLTEKRDLSSDQIRAIDRLKDRTGFHVLMGSAADAASYEATQYGQGLLTYALLRGLRGAALREGEYADVSQLFQYAADQVPELARGVGGIQRPIVAAPLGTGFDVGQFTAPEKAQVPLAQVKPLLLRPLLLNPDEVGDTLNLTPLLARQLTEASYAAPRGAGNTAGTSEAPVVYVDADELPGALRPGGTYSVAGNVVTVRLVLRRDGQSVTPQPLQISGDKNDVPGLVAKIAAAIVQAAQRRP